MISKKRWKNKTAMSTLAIKGHPTRGSEVIALLEMLGGNNKHQYAADCSSLCFYIGETGYVYYDNANRNNGYQLFTLEEFEEKFPYKVGDKVIDSKTNSIVTIYCMHWSDNNNCAYYDVKKLNNTGCRRCYRHLRPYKEQETMKDTRVVINDNGDKIHLVTLTSEITEIEVSNSYEIKEVNGKYYAVKKKPKYPSSYEECAKLLNTFCGSIEGHKGILLVYLQQLIICRDAYWKIAGEEMGLGKPWEPDWSNGDETKFCIYITENIISLDIFGVDNRILAFPTEEMRDAFCENFKDVIKQCKELL